MQSSSDYSDKESTHNMQTMHAEETSIKRGVTPGHPSSSLGERIQRGQSLLTLTNLITPEEIEFLARSSLALAASQETENQRDGDGQGDRAHLCVRMPILAAAQRDNSTDDLHLPEPVSLLLEEILERAYIYIDRQLCPSVKDTLFANNDHEEKEELDTHANNDATVDDDANNGTASTSVSMTQLFHNHQLDYSIREPAINVYTAPFGHFGMHKDGKSLTILVPLSDPSVHFDGGGTAFWKESYPQPGMHDPALVLTPKPGTALLFGGTLSHSGMHIKSGKRVVFVASFSRLVNDKGAPLLG